MRNFFSRTGHHPTIQPRHCLVMMMMMVVWRVMMVSDSQVCRPVLVNKERVHPEVKQVAIRHIARPVK